MKYDKESFLAGWTAALKTLIDTGNLMLTDDTNVEKFLKDFREIGKVWFRDIDK